MSAFTDHEQVYNYIQEGTEASKSAKEFIPAAIMATEASNLNNASQPSIVRFVLGFILVGVAWGFTTPFMRRAAVEEDRRQASRPKENSTDAAGGQWIYQKMMSLSTTVADLLQRPGYSIPLVLNLTGSIWFFLLVGQAELSLTVPITNSLAFLFTVLGEWWVEGKVITRDTWIGMSLVLGGIALCVYSKL